MSAVIQQPVVYGNAEARGRIRAWKNKLAERHRVMDAAARADKRSPLFTAYRDLALRSSHKGRQRAFEKIEKALAPAGVKLETLHLGGKRSWALWSILKPRGPVTVDAADESGLAQHCVVVDYVMAGYLPAFDAVGTMDGFWGLEVPDHALGRAVERSGLLQPETIIRDAHRNLLDLPATLFSDGLLQRGFFVRAGAGAFRCRIFAGEDVSRDGDYCVQVIASTWIDDNQLHEDQVVLCDKAAPGDRLGDGWLLPRPLRQIRDTENGCEVLTYKDMPD